MIKYVSRFAGIYIIAILIFLFVMTGINQTVTVMAENTPIHRDPVIVIDAGHGGEDGGATSCSGKLESMINLEIALKLEAVCHLLGYETCMIRTEDISVYTEGNTLAAKKASDLRQRVRVVNNISDAILISIHQNTFSDSVYSGAQVFYAPTVGSKELATITQSQLAVIDPTNHRQAKASDRVYLMQHIQKTGILVECGFLSNPLEDQKLQNPEYQKMLCCAIVSALAEYISY